jgi:hypothetical protein
MLRGFTDTERIELEARMRYNDEIALRAQQEDEMMMDPAETRARELMGGSRFVVEEAVESRLVLERRLEMNMIAERMAEKRSIENRRMMYLEQRKRDLARRNEHDEKRFQKILAVHKSQMKELQKHVDKLKEDFKEIDRRLTALEVDNE